MLRLASLRLTNAVSAHCLPLLATLLAGCPAQRPADGLQTSQAVQSAVPSASSQASALDPLKALNQSKALGLRVTVEADHWRVETQGAPGSGPCTAPLALPALKRCARSLKRLFPNEVAATVAANRSLPYRLIVETLDALRADEQGELFPEFSLATIAEPVSSK